MVTDYIPVFLHIVIATAFAVATLIASVVLGKRAMRNRIKDSAYECGMLPVGEGQARFSVKFYLVAHALCPLRHRGGVPLSLGGGFPGAGGRRGRVVFVWSMAGFVGILFVAYLYALKKGALEWR